MKYKYFLYKCYRNVHWRTCAIKIDEKFVTRLNLLTKTEKILIKIFYSIRFNGKTLRVVFRRYLIAVDWLPEKFIEVHLYQIILNWWLYREWLVFFSWKWWNVANEVRINLSSRCNINYSEIKICVANWHNLWK